MIDKIIITIYTAFLLLMPEGITFGWFSYSKILLILSIGIIVYNIVTKKFSFKELFKFKEKWNILALLGVVGFVFISNTVNWLLGNNVSISDLYEVIRPFLYILIFVIYYIYFKRHKEYLIKSILIMILLNCILSITQYFDLFKLNELYVRYTAPTQYDTLINGYSDPRVLGFTSNPNVYGFFITLLAIFTLFLITQAKKKLKGKIALYILFGLEVLNVFMTMSRTSFVCLVLGILGFIFLYNIKNGNIKKLLKTILIFIGCFIVVFLVLPNESTWRIKQLVDIKSVRTWQLRVDHNEQSIDTIFERNSEINEEKTKLNVINLKNAEKYLKLIIGHGSEKLVNTGIHDNEYLVIIFRYGFIGLILILLIFTLAIFQVRKNNISFPLLFTISIISLIYMYPASLFHSYKLFPILMIIYAFCYSFSKEFNATSKKVLVFATYFPPSGGVGVFRISKFTKYLKKLGYDPVVVTTANKYCINYDEYLLNDVKGIKVYRLDFKCKNNKVAKYFAEELRVKIDDIIELEKPELLFFTGGPFQILKIGRYVYSKYGIPYIIDIRDPWSLQTFPKLEINNFVKNILGRFKDIIEEHFVFQKAKYVTLINKELYEKYTKVYFYCKNKFKIIPNGFDEDDYKELNEIKFDNFTIGYAGKYTQMLGERNPYNLFKVIKRLNEEGIKIEYLSIGNIEPQIVKMASEVGCEKYCKFIGFKTHRETLEYQKGCDVNLILTTNEEIEQTGKVFDLINLNRPIIIITDVISNLTEICKDVDYIKIFKYNEVEELYNYLKDLNSLNVSYSYKKYDQFLKYNRNELTKELIKLIEK